ncbi:cysteine desulfurase family protein [Macellibacteroides fermentans]|uniref:cysteine desulfurase family protein n=1 Tax=Macellibacteroides fermentans TaxID=879969 RepID=UPI00406C9498
MKQLIYADNAATTKLNNDVLEAMIPWLTNEYGNASQPYSFSKKPKKALAAARASIAECINATPEEIFFTSGGTESDNWAIKGSAFADPEKRVTITTTIEHHAVLNACAAIERLGYPVSYLCPDSYGIIAAETLESVITHSTRLVSVMHSNNEIGTIEPIKELADIAHKHGAIFHTDAVQAVGHVPIDVKALGIDLLSASAHKFNGPKGIGFLYIRKGTNIARLNDGGNQEFGMRAGTENVALIVGMAEALESNCEAIDKNEKHITRMESILINKLNTVGMDFKRNGSDNHLPGNISLSFNHADGEALLHRLDLMGICVSTGSACDNVNTQVSHVLKAINLDDDYAKGTIRISLGKDNTYEEAEIIADSLIQILTV